ncbi:MotA/TolQ/ExbB proton channel family protein [Ponticaulis sp.]|uniref:MotA/TolQ/ExbB proton channel family protein n=1 Tax=Ponticaulis sp. TaxID=2020902 RepID=UPI0025D6FCB0|nr:MotA/TolQ/ExbB proton channel family protein [Ponticaulis sp.]
MIPYLSHIFTFSGAVLIPLAVCSIIALALIIDKLMLLARLRVPGADLKSQIRSLARETKARDALAALQRFKPFYADAVSVLERHAEEAPELREKAVSLSLQTVTRETHQRLTGLSTIASLAPLLGLLGTVIGLMMAFRALQDVDGPVDPSIVASGLWQAMITTVAGLVIAVPCLVAFAWLKSRLRNHLADAASLLSEISLSISIHGNRLDD